MTPDELLLVVFCTIDDLLRQLDLGKLRARGPEPALSDSEVLTMEIVGETLGYHADSRLFWYFRRHHASAFPALTRIHRSSFVRHAANLWAVKQLLHRHLVALLTDLHCDWLVDSMPVPVCRFARARPRRLYPGQAEFGFDHIEGKTFYGFRLHVRTNRQGLILSYQLAAANVAETEVIWDLQPPAGSEGIGDRNYWNPKLYNELSECGVRLRAAFKHASRDPDPERSRKLNRVRRLIETVQGQLADRYGMKKPNTRDLWHLENRIHRKVLGHTVAFWLCQQAGEEPLRFERLTAA